MTEPQASDQLTIADIACPACGEPCPHDAGFCESCGASLTGAEAGAATPPDATSAPADTGNCLVCGGTVLADGFCDTCGNRALTRRDHWTESPATWIGGVCDKGIVHVRNEDAMALAGNAEPNSFAALVVCDGVTSAPNSDQASLGAVRVACERLAADSMTSAPTGAPTGPPSVARRVADWSDSLTKACALAQRSTVEVAESLGNPDEPPSCTFAAAIVDQDLLVVGWCGDSRVYWLPDEGPASALSRDHSLGTEMIDSGIDPAVAEADPTSHTITRWLGADSPTPSPDIVSMGLHEDGWVLVCSDGLWNYASGADTLRELLRTAVADGATTPTAISESLAAFANSCGGHDNISVALARITSPDQRKD